MQRLIINDTAALDEFCQACALEPYISIDTEFVREHTYYPRLCLVQIGVQERAAIIDPLAEQVNLAPLYALLRNPAVLKVFHAARQDLEIFYHLMGTVVDPVYDTQVAAMALGVQDQISYHGLVKGLLNLDLDKGSRMTQWDKRPLSDAQLDYAFLDVEPLYRLYPVQRRMLEGREDWIADVHARLIGAENLRVEPEESWRLLKLHHLKPKQLGAVRAIAAWREAMAQRLDLPRRWVLSDESIVVLAQNRPKTVAESSKLRLRPKKIHQFDQLIKVIQQAEPIKHTPQQERVPANEDLLDVLRLAMHSCTRKHNVSARLLCSAEQLQDLSGLEPLSPAWQDHPLQQGWRRRVFGEVAEQIACGKVVLRYCDRQLDWLPLTRVNSL